MHGKVVASQFPRAGELDALLITAWPFLLCQKPIVAVSPPVNVIVGGFGLTGTLAQQVDSQPAAEVTVTQMWTGLFVSVPAAYLMLEVPCPAVMVPFMMDQE